MLTGAGGRLGVVHARALKKADPTVYLIGVDGDPFRIHRAATDEIHLVPRSSDPDFIPSLRETIHQTRPDLLLTNVTADIPVISEARDDIGCKTFLPERATVRLC